MKKIYILLIVIVIAVIVALFYFTSGSPALTTENNESNLAAAKGFSGSSIVPPEIISVMQTSTSTFELVWTDPNSKESGYMIFRGSGDNYLLQPQYAKVGANVTKFVDTKIVPGMTYSYSVRPYISKGNQMSLYPSSNLVVVTAN
ncbi:MAG: fibronectin type III domain-containing protein [Candidatus Pacebacteria bacterium]|nr:fibronectin type III domain-containing protein [Candidatus Paceibacterota bacterium]